MRPLFALALALPLLLSGCIATPLTRASKAGKLDKVKAQIAKGANVNSRRNHMDGHGFSRPISYAVENGHLEVVRALLDAGAKIEGDGWMESALFDALFHQRKDIAKLLLDRGAETRLVVIGMSSFMKRLRVGGYFQIKYQAGLELLYELRPDLNPAQRAVVQTVAPPPAPKTEERELLTPRYSLPERENDFAVVVGIDKYSDLPAADYAERDAAAVVAHMEALGVPRRNIIHLAGAKAVRSALVKNLNSFLPKNINADSRVYFYFSGHGAPDPKTGEAYLVPWDGDASFLSDTAYPLSRLYAQLGSLPAKQVFVALDACFSGGGGRSVLAKGARPLVTKVNIAPTEDKLTVLNAAAGDEITATYDLKQHGLFTYYLLDGLNGAAADEQGHVTSKSLFDYLKPNVQNQARRQNRAQTPGYQAAADLTLR